MANYPKVAPPISPYQGTRTIDDFGAGGFGAPRSRDGKGRVHKGLDFKGSPGDTANFPIDGRLWPAAGRAYAAGDTDLGSVHVYGEAEFTGLRCVLLYVKQTLANDTHGKQGSSLGILQDVAAYHEKHNPGKTMQNHCHFELYELENGVWVLRDPTPFLKV